MKYSIFIVLIALVFFSIPNLEHLEPLEPGNSGKVKTVHLYVALCDNENQGIVKVPPKIGNGKDPGNNLYWGAAYGVRSFFRKSRDWKCLETVKNPKTNVLERIVFKHRSSETYLLADAYDGAKIKPAIIDFLKALAGDNIEIPKLEAIRGSLSFGGASDLIVYIGHNGLMDFTISESCRSKRSTPREVIILACYSKFYFKELIKESGAHPLLWTSGLMAPEAYTLEGALEGWILGETREQIRRRAARAYARYQGCGLKSAMNLLLTGW